MRWMGWNGRLAQEGWYPWLVMDDQICDESNSRYAFLLVGKFRLEKQHSIQVLLRPDE